MPSGLDPNFRIAGPFPLMRHFSRPLVSFPMGPMRPERIPLFPLNVVLFPGEQLPLHIFEPRYRRMVRECLDAKAPFGMLLALPNGVVRVGCTAEILEVVKRYRTAAWTLSLSAVARSALSICSRKILFWKVTWITSRTIPMILPHRENASS